MSSTDPAPPGADSPDARNPVDGDDELFRSVARVHPAHTPHAVALRGGVLRRPGQGHVAGVCAALAVAGGLPPRLVRLTAIGLLALGIGLPLYLLAALLLPRERSEAGEDAHRIDMPLRELIRGDPGRGDVLIALAVVPAAIAGYFWLGFVSIQEPAPLRLLIPIVGVAVIMLGWAALRARRARSAYLFAALGRRAGVLDETELARTVEELRRYAPRAWSGLDPATADAPGIPAAAHAVPGASSDAGEAPASGSHRARPVQRPRPLGARAGARAAGILLVVGTVSFILVALFPFLAPGLANTEPLPAIGRLGAAAAVTTVAAGGLLIVIGLRGRRSLAVPLIGVLAFAMFATSVFWVRLTDSSQSAPLVVSIDAYRPGFVDACANDGVRRWNRTLVIDLSGVSDPSAQTPSPLERWRAQNPGVADTEADLTMYIECDRMVGDVQVVLPAAGAVDFHSMMSSSLGDIHGDVPVSGAAASMLAPSVELWGSLGTGDLTYTRRPS